ncbi:predicted protein [Nematostella vectensis]|uniref:Uncharacterized protein n=1 Tax=Nematostella vectensis TaxID=45351 RepID=A7S9X5_NEMVE|nr:uncharacterized protein LOC5511142 [Nematostella vectensis]EDO39499.1 predicted protein [Nematostella vectensis]|eukprot:XP_001631562.1 predicted protein [Nematostella vectensis]
MPKFWVTKREEPNKTASVFSGSLERQFRAENANAREEIRLQKEKVSLEHQKRDRIRKISASEKLVVERHIRRNLVSRSRSEDGPRFPLVSPTRKISAKSDLSPINVLDVGELRLSSSAPNSPTIPRKQGPVKLPSIEGSPQARGSLQNLTKYEDFDVFSDESGDGFITSVPPHGYRATHSARPAHRPVCHSRDKTKSASDDSAVGRRHGDHARRLRYSDITVPSIVVEGGESRVVGLRRRSLSSNDLSLAERIHSFLGSLEAAGVCDDSKGNVFEDTDAD